MSALEGRQRLLTCVLPRGKGLPLLRRLSEEKGIVSANLNSARRFTGSGGRGVFDRLETDVLTVVVPADRADEVFEWIYWEAEVSTQRGRLLFMARLLGATPFRLPHGVPRETA